MEERIKYDVEVEDAMEMLGKGYEREAFKGFTPPSSNYSKLPHQFIDLLPVINSMAEMKVLIYILRHTWGFSEYDTPKKITMDEFCNGRKMRDGKRMDKGTGMAPNSVRAGIQSAVDHGFISVAVDDTDLARIEKSYQLNVLGVQDLNPDLQDLNPDVQKLNSDQRKKLKKETKKEVVTTATSLSSWMESVPLRDAHNLLVKASGMAALSDSLTGKLETVYQLVQEYGEKDTLTALRDARSAWVGTLRKNGGGKYSVLNGGWVDWAVAHLAGETPWSNGKSANQPKQRTPEELAALRKQAERDFLGVEA